ncbi:hypothetical protein C8F04DRAFT_1249380 [Mycena alexandri]|uniref:Uncharacterized protein n=1 Tax=Mycena alexandri TaxID=1745969 RepID=A0AAD6XGZ7_9AGAR|nr:hypothetical protein C8F04DRAFT_1249380 [Mycena alexandri]
MTTKITVANAAFLYPAALCRDLLRALDAAGSETLFTDFGLPLSVAMASVAYLMAPAIPIYEGFTLKDNAEPILRHYIQALRHSAHQQKIIIPECKELALPRTTAFLWSNKLTLQNIDQSLVDLNGWGVHCILLPEPLSSKRPLDSDSQDPDPKKQHLPQSTSNDTDIADPDIRRRILEKASILFDVIRATAWHPLSNPCATTVIPFPTLHSNQSSDPDTAFDLDMIDGIPSFRFKGRHFLEATLLPFIETEYYRLRPSTRICLFGTAGTGKAHLLTVAAVLLLSKQIPAVFLTLSGKRPSIVNLRDALLLAMVAAGITKHHDHIFNACQGDDSPKNLEKLFRHLGSDSFGNKLVFVILGLDSLSKEDANYVLGLTQGQLVCLSLGGNSTRRADIEDKIAAGKEGHKVLYLNGGIEENDLKGWLHQHEQEIGFTLTESDSKRLQATTGNVPALLSKVFQAMKKDLGCKGLREHHLDLGLDLRRIMSLHIEKVLERHPAKQKELRLLLLAALHHDMIDVSPYLIDNRYLYCDKQERWRTTSLFAYLAVLRCLLDLGNWVRYFEASKWLGCMSIVRDNPSMLGYAVEYGVTAALRDGLNTSNLKIPGDLPVFSLPKGGQPGQNIIPGIYVPVEFNHRFIDCVAVWHNNKTVCIAPMQITIVDATSKHSDSVTDFFTDDWRLWKAAAARSGFSFQWDFIWLINIQADKAMKILQKRGHIPRRRVHTVSINSVCPTIYEALQK